MVWIKSVDKHNEAARHAAIREVLKYVCKPHGIIDSLDPGRIGEYLWAMRHQRLVSGWGRWYRVQDDVEKPELPEEHVIRWGFSTVVVPKVCPVCHKETVPEDWGIPYKADRLAAQPTTGRYHIWDAPVKSADKAWTRPPELPPPEFQSQTGGFFDG
jgi:hypothetical protein